MRKTGLDAMMCIWNGKEGQEGKAVGEEGWKVGCLVEGLWRRNEVCFEEEKIIRREGSYLTLEKREEAVCSPST